MSALNREQLWLLPVTDNVAVMVIDVIRSVKSIWLARQMNSISLIHGIAAKAQGADLSEGFQRGDRSLLQKTKNLPSGKMSFAVQGRSCPRLYMCGLQNGLGENAGELSCLICGEINFILLPVPILDNALKDGLKTLRMAKR